MKTEKEYLINKKSKQTRYMMMQFNAKIHMYVKLRLGMEKRGI